MSARLKTWSLRLLKWAIVIELAWLVFLNALLALPLTQDVINLIRPEKFFVSWERAWTPYPACVHVSGAHANANSRSQIWAFEAESVSGSIALLPLLLKQVWISDVEGADIDFRMRPRPKPDRDYTATEAWFPKIEGREVTPAVPPPPQKWWPWDISVSDIKVSGRLGTGSTICTAAPIPGSRASWITAPGAARWNWLSTRWISSSTRCT